MSKLDALKPARRKRGKLSPWWIYELRDPRPGDLHLYVGKAEGTIGGTYGPEARYAQHLKDPGATYKANWIRSLLALGLKPTLEIVREGIGAGACEAEIAQIALRRAQGYKVTNSTDGGDGTTGRPVSDRCKATASKTMKAQNADPEFAAKRDAGTKAMHADPEFAAKRDATSSKTMKAQNADPEFAAKRDATSSKTMKAQNADPEFAAKRDAGVKAMHADPEFAAKLVARTKAMHADLEFAAKHVARMKAKNADPEFQRKCQEGKARARAARLAALPQAAE